MHSNNSIILYIIHGHAREVYGITESTAAGQKLKQQIQHIEELGKHMEIQICRRKKKAKKQFFLCWLRCSQRLN